MSEIELSEFCALQSQETAQEIFGTAVAETTVWLFLEYVEPWTPKSVTDNNLPETVQDWLQGQVSAIAQSRVVFIKKSSQTPAAFHFYVGISREADQRLYRFQVANYEALLDLDVAGILADGAAFEANLSDEQLYLVCTNGKRDRCCAKFGLPVYEAMTQIEGASVWQCTHLGGHRYAPVVGVFPAGLYYRVIEPEDGAALVAATQAGELRLNDYRGRNCYIGVVQAADYFLRQQTGQLEINRYRLHSEVVSDGVWQVTFAETGTDVTHTVDLKQQLTAPLMASCGVKVKMKPQPHYQFVDYRS